MHEQPMLRRVEARYPRMVAFVMQPTRRDDAVEVGKRREAGPNARDRCMTRARRMTLRSNGEGWP